MKPGISIILCCHNSEKRLPEVLESLSFQKGINDLRWEILVVNNASTDNTVRVAEEYRDKYLLPVKILNEPQAGLSFARMTGIKASVYSFICYVDDDNRLDENYISTAYRLMTNHEEIGLVGGCGSPVFESEPPFWFDKFQRAYAVGPQGEKAGYMTGEIKTLYGAGVTLRKSAWLKMESNGFTYHLTGRKGKSLSSGEDSELCYAIQLSGYKLWYDPSLTFTHFMPEQRLNYDYLKNLFKAFGRSDAVLNLYAVEIENTGRLKKQVMGNWFLCFIYYIYKLSGFLPAFLKSETDELKKMNRRLLLARQISLISRHLKITCQFAAIKMTIKKLKSH